MLDVGCGPFPKSGIASSTHTINRTLVDALADDYHLLLKNNGLNPQEQIILCNAEELDSQFTSPKFDVIFTKNALDHTYNPILALQKMFGLLLEGGMIILEHFRNEGSYTNYA